MENLQWIKEGNRHLLKNKEEVLVDLTHTLSGKDTFLINERQYTIIRKGFWTPRYHVMYRGESLLELTYGVWKSVGKIIFSDGSEYYSDYQSKHGLKLRFLDNENEILVFGIQKDDIKSMKMSFYVGIVMEDAEKLLIMAALGMSIFSSLFSEMSSGEDIVVLIA